MMMMMISKLLYPRKDIDGLYASRKERRGLANIKVYLDASTTWVKDNIKIAKRTNYSFKNMTKNKTIRE